MTKTKVSWTKAEEKLIIDTLKEYPTNLNYGLKLVEPKLKNRTLMAITARYYTRLRKDPNNRIISTGSSRGFTQNVKNLPVDNEGKLPEQELKHFQQLAKQMLDLPVKERNIILNLFSGNNNTINQ